MGIESLVYGRLSSDPSMVALVGDRIYPTAPPENVSALPALVYQVTSDAPVPMLAVGRPGLCRYSVDVTTWAVNLADLLDVQDLALMLLHGWRSDPVQLGWLASQSTTPDDPGFRGEQSFSLWAKLESEGLVVARGHDATVSLRTLVDGSGLVVDDALVEGQLGGYTFDLLHTSGGNYQGLVPGSQTATMLPGRYTITVTATADDLSLTLSIGLRVV